MFHKKQERKNSHLGLKLAVCALAAVGAISIVSCCKDKLSCACDKMMSIFHKKPTPQPTCDPYTCEGM